ncbi:CatB-related O-acetyltransferase [Nitratireductor sp. GISD-1A_MAKvit]|uniref:CatB-related O-acetyltransferase n=1 Tax=Nitratireductor sp. GISD-1A_MAKvit TaxID=3234198 RepID=UPI0034655B76
MHGPDPATPYPMAGFPRTVFLKNVVTRSNIEVGDFSYYDDPNGAERFEDNNVLYHFDFLGDRLLIGNFAAIAEGATFVMNGANHTMSGFSTFPFNIFGNGWENGFDAKTYLEHGRGDTMVGNDVWIGREAQVMPGVTIGDGAVIGSRAVVASDIPPYAVAVGNPARVLRVRFDPEVVETLLGIAWWNWPVEKISRNLEAIRGADLQALRTAC